MLGTKWDRLPPYPDSVMLALRARLPGLMDCIGISESESIFTSSSVPRLFDRGLVGRPSLKSFDGRTLMDLLRVVLGA